MSLQILSCTYDSTINFHQPPQNNKSILLGKIQKTKKNSKITIENTSETNTEREICNDIEQQQQQCGNDDKNHGE